MKVRLARGLKPYCGTSSFEPDEAEGRTGVELSNDSGYSKTLRIELCLNPLKKLGKPSRRREWASVLSAESGVRILQYLSETNTFLANVSKVRQIPVDGEPASTSGRVRILFESLHDGSHGRSRAAITCGGVENEMTVRPDSHFGV